MNLKVELPDANGGNVISIEVARRSRYDRTCHHLNIYTDTDLAEVECRDCGKLLNPIEWIAMLAEEWDRVTRRWKLHVDAAELFEEKTRTKCQHCGRLTKINPPDEFTKKMRERNHMVFT